MNDIIRTQKKTKNASFGNTFKVHSCHESQHNVDNVDIAVERCWKCECVQTSQINSPLTILCP